LLYCYQNPTYYNWTLPAKLVHQKHFVESSHHILHNADLVVDIVDTESDNIDPDHPVVVDSLPVGILPDDTGHLERNTPFMIL
jgi:hypothetical protein